MRTLAAGLTVGLTFGLLLMHGLDARAVAQGHGLTGSPSAVLAAVDDAVADRGPGGETAAVDPGGRARAMAGHCLAVLALAVAALLLAFRTLLRLDDSEAATGETDAAGRRVADAGGRARPSAPPRIALCVSLC